MDFPRRVFENTNCEGNFHKLLPKLGTISGPKLPGSGKRSIERSWGNRGFRGPTFFWENLGWTPQKGGLNLGDLTGKVSTEGDLNRGPLQWNFGIGVMYRKKRGGHQNRILALRRHKNLWDNFFSGLKSF